jgi:hypothetical protein
MTIAFQPHGPGVQSIHPNHLNPETTNRSVETIPLPSPEMFPSDYFQSICSQISMVILFQDRAASPLLVLVHTRIGALPGCADGFFQGGEGTFRELRQTAEFT